jgi:hypothetical protein
MRYALYTIIVSNKTNKVMLRPSRGDKTVARHPPAAFMICMRFVSAVTSVYRQVKRCIHIYNTIEPG